MANKDRLKSTLNRRPTVTAQHAIIPDLSRERVDTKYSNSIDNTNDTHSESDTDPGIAMQPQLAKEELALQEALDESKVEVTRAQTKLDSATEQNTQLTTKLAQQEAEETSLEAEVEAAGINSGPELSKLQADLRDALKEHERLAQQVDFMTNQVELMRQTESTTGDIVVDEFETARFLKNKGKKKTDTYKQTGFYQDKDIEERLAKYLKKARYDKSTVINAAIDHLLTTMGF